MLFRKGRSTDDKDVVVIDLAYLDRLAGHIGPGATRELLADGLLELHERIGRIRPLADAMDVGELGSLVHNVSGLAGHLGLSQLSRAASRAEKDLRAISCGSSVVQEIALQIEETGSPALDALRQYLGDTDVILHEP